MQIMINFQSISFSEFWFKIVRDTLREKILWFEK